MRREAIAPESARRYTVILDTLSIAATSCTVSRSNSPDGVGDRVGSGCVSLILG
jgi:hypothetical protein